MKKFTSEAARMDSLHTLTRAARKAYQADCTPDNMAKMLEAYRNEINAARECMTNKDAQTFTANMVGNLAEIIAEAHEQHLVRVAELNQP